MSQHREWQVCVYCQNEQERIAACLTSIDQAMGSRSGLITVIINGCSDDSMSQTLAAAAAIATPVEVFSIPHGDKSNAINVFLHELRGEADLYFAVDGYVTIAPQAMVAITDRLAVAGEAVAASGVATSGRSAAATLRTIEIGGTLQGQFHALTLDFVRRMVAGGIRLPVGLYRGDGLLGSMAAHDLDALGQPWRNSRLIGVADASFAFTPLSPWRPQDLRRQFRRKIRQMRGVIENAAIRQVIYVGGYAALPAFADDMIRDFLASQKMPTIPVYDRPFMALALRQHRAASRPEPQALRPRRVAMPGRDAARDIRLP